MVSLRIRLNRHRVLDVLEGRSRDVLGDWLTERGQAWCQRIRLATLDPSAGYRRALEDHLPRAMLVVEHWHCVRLANQTIDEVRRRVQNQTLGHRGRKGDPLYRIRRVLLTADEWLTEERFWWMASLLEDGDPDGEVAAAWIAKELLREAFSAIDEAHARRPMIAVPRVGRPTPDIPEVSRLTAVVYSTARSFQRVAQEAVAVVISHR